MEDYVRVDVLKYVKEGLESGVLVPIEAEKAGKIAARRGVVGEEVITWTQDTEGRPVKERVDKVKLDPETGKPGWVVTKVDDEGHPIIDDNGHTNTWIIGDSKFIQRYTESDIPGVYKSSAGIQIFVQIPDNIILFQWGKEHLIPSGGYINITNQNDMYGITSRDFDDTYVTLGKSSKKLVLE